MRPLHALIRNAEFLNLDFQSSLLLSHREKNKQIKITTNEQIFKNPQSCMGEFHGLDLKWHISPLHVSIVPTQTNSEF